MGIQCTFLNYLLSLRQSAMNLILLRTYYKQYKRHISLGSLFQNLVLLKIFLSLEGSD